MRRARAPGRVSSASAASSHGSGVAGPVVKTRHPAPNASAAAMARTSRSCCSAHRSGRARWNGPRPMRLTTRSPEPTASTTRATPSSQPCASSFATETPTWSIAVLGPEREVVDEREAERRDGADARRAGASVVIPSVRPRAMLLPPSSCRFTPVTKADSRAGEVHRGERDVGRLPEPREVHASRARSLLGRHVRVAPVVEHVSGADRVAADAGRGVVDGDRSGQCVQPALRRDVRGEARARALGLTGRDVDDRAAHRCARGGAARRGASQNGAVRSTRRIASHASVARSPARPSRWPPPAALFTSTERPPHASAAAATRSVHAASSPRSAAMNAARTAERRRPRRRLPRRARIASGDDDRRALGARSRSRSLARCRRSTRSRAPSRRPTARCERSG